MPRKARIDAPGALHHIVIRGIEQKPIFKDSQDYQNFIERLSNILSESSTPCFAWVLMTNHAHLLLRTGLTSISTVMRRLLTGYAQQFNRRHRRYGHLFQNRYKSFLCEEELYLLELVRYIHLNPIRAGMVEDLKALNSYSRSGHSVIMGRVKHDWQDTNYVLARFGDSVKEARKSYLKFVRKAIDQGRRPELVGGGLLRSIGGWSALKAIRGTETRVISDERILGSSEFVETVLKSANEAYERKTVIQAKGINLDHLIGIVAARLELDVDLILSSSRQRTVALARSIICCVAVDQLMLSGTFVASRLNLTPSAVSKLVSRGRLETKTREIAKELPEVK
jgi:REP element-mobilizing transposase RayT